MGAGAAVAGRERSWARWGQDTVGALTALLVVVDHTCGTSSACEALRSCWARQLAVALSVVGEWDGEDPTDTRARRLGTSPSSLSKSEMRAWLEHACHAVAWAGRWSLFFFMGRPCMPLHRISPGMGVGTGRAAPLAFCRRPHALRDNYRTFVVGVGVWGAWGVGCCSSPQWQDAQAKASAHLTVIHVRALPSNRAHAAWHRLYDQAVASVRLVQCMAWETRALVRAHVAFCCFVSEVQRELQRGDIRMHA